jgi:hypothetical protein
VHALPKYFTFSPQHVQRSAQREREREAKAKAVNDTIGHNNMAAAAAHQRAY